MERSFEYVIKIGRKEVWKGLNPTQKYFEIKSKNPGKEVSIAWRTKEKVLVFGRVKSLDLFDANFLKGKTLRLKDNFKER